MSEYLVIYENAGRNWSAYVPDLPGCISTGASENECKDNIQDAIATYLDSAREMGKPVPPPSTRGEYVKVPRIA
jgi:predicted RNase H-like HicB family nuclease